MGNTNYGMGNTYCALSACGGTYSEDHKHIAYTTAFLDDIAWKLPKDETIVLIIEMKVVKNLFGQSLRLVHDSNNGPFVEIQLIEPDPIAGLQLQRSTYRHDANYSAWEPPERFQFISSGSNEVKVLFSVYHYHPMREPEPLGDAVFHAKIGAEECETKIQSKTLHLINPLDGVQRGEVVFDYYLETMEFARSFQRHELYEYQRWKPTMGWGNTYPGHLLSTDPGRWGTIAADEFAGELSDVEPPIPPNWLLVTNWHVQATEEDADGWQYGKEFESFAWQPTVGSRSKGIFIYNQIIDICICA
jgi:hypothetical protein